MSDDRKDIWHSLFERIDEKNDQRFTIVTEDARIQTLPSDETDAIKIYELFIEKFLVKYGLPHLYYLHKILWDMMGYLVKYVIGHQQVSSKPKLERFLRDSLKWYSELQEMINCQKLIDEISVVKQQHSGKKIRLHMSKYAKKLTSLYYSADEKLKSDTWDWRIKAEAFIQHGVLGDNWDEEAIVYLCGHEIDCEEAIRKLIPKLQEIERIFQEDDLLEITQDNYNAVATMLRVIQLAGIGKMAYLIEELSATLIITPPSLLKPDSPDTIESCLKKQIQLLKSDFAVQHLSYKLVLFHLQVQEWLKQAFHREAYAGWHPNIRPVAENLTLWMAATFMLGQSRLSKAVSDKIVVKLSEEYLLRNQHDDGFWWIGKGKIEPSLDILWTATIIHALSMAKPHGWQRAVRDGAQWLRKQQTVYGDWPDVSGNYSRIKITSMVLEAIDLADGKNPATYNLLEKDESDSISSSTTAKKYNTLEGKEVTRTNEYHVESGTSEGDLYLAGTVNNVTLNRYFLEKTNIETIKSKTPDNRQSVKQSSKIPKKPKIRFTVWKDGQNAWFIFDENERVQFQYKDEQYDLKLKHESICHQILLLLRSSEFSSKQFSEFIKFKRSKKRVISDIVRQANERLNTKIKSSGIFDIPDNIKFVGTDDETKKYRLFIPTKDIQF